MFEIRLPARIEARLSRLATRSGISADRLAQKAIEEFLEDEEDFFVALTRQLEKRRGIPLKEVVKRLEQDS